MSGCWGPRTAAIASSRRDVDESPSSPRPSGPPPDTGELLAVGIAMIVLGQMRTLEERIDEPGQRWEILRRSLEQFVHEQFRPRDGP